VFIIHLSPEQNPANISNKRTVFFEWWFSLPKTVQAYMNAGLVMKLTPIECMDFGPEDCWYCSGQPTAPSMHVFNL
jgi:hypothetical protein